MGFLWFLNWWPFALTHHLPLFHTVYADWPVGTDLAWKTSVPALGILAAPFTLRFGALPVFNLLMIASPALAGWGVYLAAFELVADFYPALLAGALFLGSGYEIGQNLGHLNLSFTVALPLCLWAVLRAARRGWAPWRLGLVLGPLLGFEFGVSQEVFASSILFGTGTLVLLWWLHPAVRPELRRLAPGLALGLGLALALAAPLLVQMLRGWAAARDGISNPADYGNDFLAAFIPTPLSLFGGGFFAPLTKHFTGNYAEQGGYFSLPLLAVLVCAAWRGEVAVRLCCAVFLVALVAGWGPFLYVRGVRLMPAPWFPFAHLPFLSAILPCRLSLYAWLAASFVLALWLKKAGWQRWALVLLCLAVLTPAQSAGRNWRGFVPPPVFAEIPTGAHVLVLPLFGREMGWQMLSGMRFYLVGQGYLGTGRPAPFRDWALFEPLWEANFTSIDPAGFAAYLARFDVQDVVVLNDGYGFFRPGMNEPQKAAQARGRLAAAGGGSTDGILFRPAIPPPTAAEVAAEEKLQMAHREDVVRRAHALHREQVNICDLRHVAARLHLAPAPFQYVYGVFFAPPVPVQSINCRP